MSLIFESIDHPSRRNPKQMMMTILQAVMAGRVLARNLSPPHPVTTWTLQSIWKAYVFRNLSKFSFTNEILLPYIKKKIFNQPFVHFIFLFNMLTWIHEILKTGANSPYYKILLPFNFFSVTICTFHFLSNKLTWMCKIKFMSK